MQLTLCGGRDERKSMTKKKSIEAVEKEVKVYKEVESEPVIEKTEIQKWQEERELRKAMAAEERERIIQEKQLELQYKFDRDKQLVKGTFHFHEVPGGLLSFVYREYPSQDLERYDLWDGMEYELPLGVARHLNKNGKRPEYEYLTDERGRMVQIGGPSSQVRSAINPNVPQNMKIIGWKHRYSFSNTNFQSAEDFSIRTTGKSV